ncbi:MAG: dihydropyrimidinase [Anaerolinea sp.]|nr:dihydropyrimidinase [Anaerolinea sp.]
MSDGLLVHDGTVVSPRGLRRADVRCRDGTIVEIGTHLAPAGEQMLDAGDSYVLPGIVDPHVHFALEAKPHRTADDFASGSTAALAGGVTTVIDFAHQHAGEGFEEALDRRLAEAVSCRTDYSLHLIVTDISGGQMAEMSHLSERGVTSAKLYSTYRAAGFFCDDYVVLEFMRAAAELGWVVMVHCENDAIVEGTRASFVRQEKVEFRYHGASRPAVAEVETVERMLCFAGDTGAAVYPVHLSVGESARLIAAARRRGVTAFGETCPHFLVADERVYEDDARAARFIHTPPLRAEREQAILWAELGAGGLQTVGSDHCGYTLAQRTDFADIVKVAPGVPGIETLLPLLYTYGVVAERMRMEDLAAVASENAARIFGLYPRKGVVAEGSDADLVIYKPHGTRTLDDQTVRSAARYSPFAGMPVRGRVAATILRGRIAFDGTDVIVPEGTGRFVPRQPFDLARV